MLFELILNVFALLFEALRQRQDKKNL